MADEDWESELDNGPSGVANYSNVEPEFKENTQNSFSSNRDFNKNFQSSERRFGSQKADNFNQNYESSGRSFGQPRGDRNDRGGGFSRGRSDRGRGGNNAYNRGFDSSDSQERSRFSGFNDEQNNDQYRSNRGGFNNDNSRSRGRGGRGRGGSFQPGDHDDGNNQRNFGRTGDGGGYDNRRDFNRKGDNDSGSRGFGSSGGGGGFGRRGDTDNSDDKKEFGSTGGNSGFSGWRNFEKKGDEDDADGKRNFGGPGDGGSFGNFGRRGNNDEREGGRGRFGKTGGYRGKNEDVGFESGKGEDDNAKGDTGPRVTYIPPPPPEDEKDIFHQFQTGINFDKYDEILVDVSGVNVPPAIMSFEDADLSETLTKNVYRAGYVKLTPIQKHSIPIITAGRDLMACAQTGSGKTAAFLLPILAHMMKNGVASSQFTPVQEPEAIIVAPTRELINQIYLDARKFAYGTIVRPVVIYGGTQTSHSLRQIFQGCNVLCATPGRLMDVIEKEKIGLSKVKFLVLDEADRMLDMGFKEVVYKLMHSPGMPSKEERQTLMFSATFPTAIQQLSREILKPDYLFVVVGLVGGACSDVEQQIIEVDEFGKRDKLLEILQNIGEGRTMVFVKTKKKADFLATFLCQEDLRATSIHGDREQREREMALRDFRTGDRPVLVATSVAARGLDIENVLHVINVDIPSDIDDYVHRIGRTGRCGNIGKAISFFDKRGDDDQRICQDLVKVLTDAHQEVPPWLEEIAFSAHGMSSYNPTSSNFRSVDSRKRGGGLQNDGFGSSGFSQPAAQEEEDWG
ncbi:putative ATP-dependent RNA helicase DDX4 isoform X3 [Anomaloglossus baeobatrachus]|uniref:putative ATP-dependent RNA helicase DDX4 isoform X3 n=1 Tax=Anomaloglossus baeobatrachus TaxID=238106 RepID=UPI003F5010FD